MEIKLPFICGVKNETACKERGDDAVKLIKNEEGNKQQGLSEKQKKKKEKNNPRTS